MRRQSRMLLLGAAVALSCFTAVLGADEPAPGTAPAQTTDDVVTVKAEPPEGAPQVDDAAGEVGAAGEVASSAAGAFEVRLLDGSRLRGRLLSSMIVMETAYGRLKVPIEQVTGFACGLDKLTERRDRIERLAGQLDDPSFETRESAQRSLLSMGPAVEGELKQRRAAASAEGARRISLVLDHFQELREEFAADAVPWRREDTLATRLFTAPGRLLIESIELEGAFGRVELPLSRIASVRRLPAAPLANALHRAKVLGSHVVGKQTMRTRIAVRPGDEVCFSADGAIHRNGSSTYVSTPGGTSRFGTYTLGAQQLYGGVLLARIGASGKWRPVGGKGRFTATREGQLHLAIGLSGTYVTRYSYTGHYDVSVYVKRDR